MIAFQPLLRKYGLRRIEDQLAFVIAHRLPADFVHRAHGVFRGSLTENLTLLKNLTSFK